MKHIKSFKFTKPLWIRKLGILKNKKALLGLLAICLIVSTAYAARIPRSGSADARVKKITYHDNDVYSLKGHYGYTTVIEFGEKERIETISLGDSEAWQVVKPHRDNLLFVKPLEQNAATNMTVVTSDHIYSFELSANKAESNESDHLTFRLRFVYSNAGGSKGFLSFDNNNTPAPLSSVSPDAWNFDYTFTGDNVLRPQRVFDDGKFTYFQFDNLDIMPAVFLVDEKGKESIVNSSVHGFNLVVHRTGSQFKLRDGDMETMIFNEMWPKPQGKESSIVPISTMKERSEKSVPSKKKKRFMNSSFFASFSTSDTVVYNN
ncbi:MAG: P-type conjugative transfer protein VirB9 [Alphaproteobacteria bacterium]|nr:P-type conjugative transfer protein VirB9 [Alphaproteobacteria bacterium]